MNDLVIIPGVTPSEQLRRELQGDTVLLAFSRGKDSIAAWLALRDAGVRVVPYHLYLIPRLSFVDESLAYFSDFFDTAIANYPHPSLARWMSELVFQPPERCATIEAAGLVAPEYEELQDLIREDLGLPHDTIVCDGVRAADSPMRRIGITTHGPRTGRTVKIVWDWKVAHVRKRIADAGVELPIDYDLFKRSFDGIDYRFLEPLRTHLPEDYRRVLDWVPLAELEIFRREVIASGDPR